MEIILVLICISVAVAGTFLVAFLLSVKSGQFDDLETPAIRILFDNKEKTEIKDDGDTGNKK